MVKKKDLFKKMNKSLIVAPSISISNSFIADFFKLREFINNAKLEKIILVLRSIVVYFI